MIIDAGSHVHEPPDLRTSLLDLVGMDRELSGSDYPHLDSSLEARRRSRRQSRR